MLACFCLTKNLIPFFRSKTIVESFLHLMVLFYKMIINKLYEVVFHNPASGAVRLLNFQGLS